MTVRDAVLIGGSAFFSGRSSSSMQMARSLAELGSRVLFVEGHPSPSGSARTQFGPSCFHVDDHPSRPLKPGEVAVVTLRRLPVIPITAPGGVREVNMLLNRKRLRKLVHELHLDQPVLLHQCWYSGSLVRKIGQSLDIVLCQDAHEESPSVTRYPGMQGYVWRAERDLIRRADGLSVSSPVLLEKRGDHARRHAVLLNGVRLEDFPTTAPEPAALAGIPRPRLVAAANFTGKYKIELLERVLSAHGSAHVVVVGPIVSGHDRIPASDRIHVLGPLPYTTLAAVLVHSDVGLLLMDNSELTRAACPLKAMEYAAAGLPTVSTPNPRIRDLAAAYPGFYRTVDARGDWKQELTAALATAGDPANRQKARMIAADHTWEQRARQLLDFIASIG